MIQVCVGKVDELNRSNELGTSMRRSYEDDMVLNPNLDVLYDITHGGWNFRGENRILLYLNFQALCVCRKIISGSA